MFLSCVLFSTNAEYQEVFYEKMTSFTCLVGHGLNGIFQLNAQSSIFTKSLLSLKAEKLALFATEKREVSSANSLTLVVTDIKEGH